MHSQMPGYARGGGGMLKFRIDRRIKRRTPNKRRVQVNAGSTGPSLK